MTGPLVTPAEHAKSCRLISGEQATPDHQQCRKCGSGAVEDDLADYVVEVQMFGALADEKRRLDLVDAISRLVYAEGEPFGECVVVGHRYQAGEQRG